jgi:large conductance mechanosensitive channel
MKNFFNEFKAFISKGNVMNLAVGVIIGAAFQGVVTSLTDNILSPIIGLFAGQNFDLLKLEVFGVTIAYGAFLTSLVNFIIMAFVIFLIVKLMNKLLAAGKKPEDQAQAPATKKCPYCYSDIHTEATRCPSCTSQLGQ